MAEQDEVKRLKYIIDRMGIYLRGEQDRYEALADGYELGGDGLMATRKLEQASMLETARVVLQTLCEDQEEVQNG